MIFTYILEQFGCSHDAAQRNLDRLLRVGVSKTTVMITLNFEQVASMLFEIGVIMMVIPPAIEITR